MRMSLAGLSMRDHFSGVAAAYNSLRTTDLEPILCIRDTLGNSGPLRGIDVACGGGRYSLLLCEHLPGLTLTLNDVNESMLSRAASYLTANGIEGFGTIEADVAHLRVPDGALDAVFTFNAIHHFAPQPFLDKAADALAGSGRLFIYTRLRSQNARSIWGRFFPEFAEREDRLYRLSEIRSWTDRLGRLGQPTVTRFRYRRRATLAQLLNQARNKHYSTFSLYAATELSRAVADFERNIRDRFPDPECIEWWDENVMVGFHKESSGTSG